MSENLNMKKIKVNEKDIEIKKLPIGKYAELIKRIQNIAGLALVADAASNKEKREVVAENIFAIALESIDDIAMVIELSSDIKAKTVKDEWGLADVVRAIQAILEANDIDFLKKVVGKHLKEIFNQSKTGSKK